VPLPIILTGARIPSRDSRAVSPPGGENEGGFMTHKSVQMIYTVDPLSTECHHNPTCIYRPTHRLSTTKCRSRTGGGGGGAMRTFGALQILLSMLQSTTGRHASRPTVMLRYP